MRNFNQDEWKDAVKLINAAPDLLHALELACGELEKIAKDSDYAKKLEGWEQYPFQHTIQICKAAISKAK